MIEARRLPARRGLTPMNGLVLDLNYRVTWRRSGLVTTGWTHVLSRITYGLPADGN